jgi:predicted permease
VNIKYLTEMMVLFSSIFLKLISALLSVIIGFLAGKFSKVDREHIASLLFYFISPIVFFAIPASATFSLAALSITLVTFIIATILCIICYNLFDMYFDEPSRNILAMTSGTANAGYFVLPVAASLFDDYTLSIYMMAVVGLSIYESSVGFFVCDGEYSSTKESIKRVMKLPNLNAFVLGCLFSLTGLTLPNFLDDFIYNMRGSYSILGMIMIGLGISTLDKFEIDFKFTGSAFLSKFVFYPILVNLFIVLDKFLMHNYNTSHYQALQLLSTAPMAANTIVFATFAKASPEKVAATVLLSAIFSLIYMPTMISLYFN